MTWAWSGSVTTTQAEVRTLPRADGAEVVLELAGDDGFGDAVSRPADDTYGSVVGFRLEGLTPDTEYH